MKFAVIQFPGSNSDQDCVHTVQICGHQAELRWHKDTSLGAVDAVLVPGGFSYGDYLRTGAIARFSPVMAEVERMADAGAPVVGICNGFQILCEAGMLPGAFIANRDLAFICRFVDVEVTDTGTVLTAAARPGQVVSIPLNSYEGSWVDPSGSGRVVMRYVDDPNGSQRSAAAVANERGNVVGVMPHPERGVAGLLGSDDGSALLQGFLRSLQPA